MATTFYIDLNGKELHSLELTGIKIKSFKKGTTASDSSIKVKGPITLADLNVLFTHFPKLQKLDISGCTFTDKAFSNQANALPEHKSLQELNVQGSNITIVHLEGLLHNTPNLTKLNITDCALYGGFNPRNNLPSLETLTTREGHNPSVVRELKQKAPALELVNVSIPRITIPQQVGKQERQKPEKKVSLGKLFTSLGERLMGPHFFKNGTSQPLLNKFTRAKNKADFLLKNELDTEFYRKLNKLPEKQRIKIVKKLVKERKKFDFDSLIIKLSDLCFETKGPLFIRLSKADFLADIIIELAQCTDNNLFVSSYKNFTNQDSNYNFPANYQFNRELGNSFSLIQSVAKHHQHKSGDDAYLNNLGSNLANKIFNKMVLNSEDVNSPSLVTTAENLQKASADTQSMRQWFSERISEPSQVNQEKVNHFFTKEESLLTRGNSAR